jgi:hypothetical protein
MENMDELSINLNKLILLTQYQKPCFFYNKIDKSNRSACKESEKFNKIINKFGTKNCIPLPVCIIIDRKSYRIEITPDIIETFYCEKYTITSLKIATTSAKIIDIHKEYISHIARWRKIDIIFIYGILVNFPNKINIIDNCFNLVDYSSILNKNKYVSIRTFAYITYTKKGPWDAQIYKNLKNDETIEKINPINMVIKCCENNCGENCISINCESNYSRCVDILINNRYSLKFKKKQMIELIKPILKWIIKNDIKYGNNSKFRNFLMGTLKNNNVKCEIKKLPTDILINIYKYHIINEKTIIDKIIDKIEIETDAEIKIILLILINIAYIGYYKIPNEQIVNYIANKNANNPLLKTFCFLTNKKMDKLMDYSRNKLKKYTITITENTLIKIFGY